MKNYMTRKRRRKINRRCSPSAKVRSRAADIIRLYPAFRGFDPGVRDESVVIVVDDVRMNGVGRSFHLDTSEIDPELLKTAQLEMGEQVHKAIEQSLGRMLRGPANTYENNR